MFYFFYTISVKCVHARRNWRLTLKEVTLIWTAEEGHLHMEYQSFTRNEKSKLQWEGHHSVNQIFEDGKIALWLYPILESFFFEERQFLITWTSDNLKWFIQSLRVQSIKFSLYIINPYSGYYHVSQGNEMIAFCIGILRIIYFRHCE